MSTAIETKTWTGRNGTVRHYITNLAEVTGKWQFAEKRNLAAWINEDGTVGYEGFNNGAWLTLIEDAVKAHQSIEAPAVSVPGASSVAKPVARKASMYDAYLAGQIDGSEYTAYLMGTGALA